MCGDNTQVDRDLRGRHPPSDSGVSLRMLHSTALLRLTAAPCGPTTELQPTLSSLTN